MKFCLSELRFKDPVNNISVMPDFFDFFFFMF